ncbi:MAG: hypothetical protein AMXMBFR83_05060 [Phycisphaerae bacterium]
MIPHLWLRDHVGVGPQGGGKPMPGGRAAADHANRRVRSAAAVLALVNVVLSLPARGQQAPPVAVVESAVMDVVLERGLVACSAGRGAGVAVGDRFWVFRTRVPPAGGRILTVADNGSTGVVDAADGLAGGLPAAILRSAALAACRETLPPETTIRGRLARTAPGRRSAWLDVGAASGLKVGDTLLIRRPVRAGFDLPLARGRVEIVREETALAGLEPVVGNALPEPGDLAELWPSPSDRASGRVESTVLSVRPADHEELILTLVGTESDGLAVGRLVDLFRGREYVGHAAIEQVGNPNSTARTIRAGQRLMPQAGDRAWVRPPPGPPARPIAAAIFQVAASPEGDLAQLAAGDTDGIKVPEKFVVRHQDPSDASVRRDIAELTINKVNDDFSIALIRPLTADGEKVRQWDFAERRRPGAPDWRAVGIVQRVSAGSRSAEVTLEPRSTLAAGRIVRWVPESPPDQPARPAGAAIVIHRSADEALIYVPPGWGNIEHMAHARVDLADGSSSDAGS